MILPKIKSLSKSLLKSAPPIADYIKKRNLKRKFNVEIDLINGQHLNENDYPSIIHFSLNKAATQYTRRILQRCAIENEIQPVDIQRYAFFTDFPYLDQLPAHEVKKYQHIFKKKGYLYSVFGGMIEGIPHLEEYKTILMIRDPRDILVSEFYSVAYSHSAPDKQGNRYDRFLRRRKEAIDSGIDTYVIAASETVHSRFLRYKKLLIDFYPNTFVTTYEQMVDDFQGWIKEILNHCNIEISTELFKFLRNENERIKPKNENIYRHLRKGKPGDYKDKLKSQTIEYLNKKFFSILDIFDYKLITLYIFMTDQLA